MTTKMWRKSSFCSDASCVEVAFDGDMVAVRDSKDLAIDPLQVNRAAWDAFIRSVKENKFQLSV